MGLQDIKDRIRKLLAVANDDGSFEAEVEVAIRAAEHLMAEYQLTRDDVVEQDGEVDVSRVQMGRHFSRAWGQRRTAWEDSLALWVQSFVGSIGLYQSSATVRSQVTDRWVRQPRYYYYGPDADCVFASEVFAEIQQVITTLANARYGCYSRGEGASYAEGFVAGLSTQLEKSVAADASDDTTRALIVRKDERAMAIVSAARKWLFAEHDVKLVAGRSNYGAGRGFSQSAYSRGRDEGARYSVSSGRRAGYLS